MTGTTAIPGRARRWAGGIAAAVFLTSMAVAGSTPASAAPEAAAPAPEAAAGAAGVIFGTARTVHPASGRALAGDDADALAALAAYWTPRRRAAAVEASAGSEVDAAAVSRAVTAIGKQTVVASAPPAGGDRGAQARSAVFSITTGKVYASFPWRAVDPDIKCSGAAVASGRRRLVVTAAHCVYEARRRNGWAVNWVFIPGYQVINENPHRLVPPLTMGVRTNWSNDGNQHSDYSFVVTANSERGQRVVDAVGGHGLTFNGGYPDVHIIGYAGVGNYQTTCETSTTRASLWEDFIQGNCRARGMSGGPWLRAFDHNTGRGNVTTVTSFSDDREPTHLFAPDFDDNARDLYNQTESRSPTS